MCYLNTLSIEIDKTHRNGTVKIVNNSRKATSHVLYGQHWMDGANFELSFEI